MALKRIYIDTETGSVDKERAALLQLSAVVEIDGEVKGTFNRWAKPHENAEVTGRALEIQGYSWKNLEDPHRISPLQLLTDFEYFMSSHVDKFDRKDKFILLGFNVRFDEDILRTFYKMLGNNYYGSWFHSPSVDVMAILAHIYAPNRLDLENFKLGTVMNANGITVQDGLPLHDSRADICATYQLYKRYIGEGTPEPIQWG